MRDRSQLGWLSNLEKTLFEISSIYSLVGVCKLRNLTSSILIRLMHLIETLYVVEPPFPRLLLHWKFLSDVSKNKSWQHREKRHPERCTPCVRCGQSWHIRVLRCLLNFWLYLGCGQSNSPSVLGAAAFRKHLDGVGCHTFTDCNMVTRYCMHLSS